MRRRSLSAIAHPPSGRRAIEIAGAGFLIAVICWYFGVDAWHAILLGCAITVTGLALQVASAAPDAADLSWRSGKRRSREGSRNDVHSLAASLRSGWGFVGLTAERRLHEIARRRLALEGLDLQSPDHRLAIEQRIGARACRALSDRHGRVPRLRALIDCLDRLDATDPTHYPAPQSSARRWGLARIPFSHRRVRER